MDVWGDDPWADNALLPDTTQNSQDGPALPTTNAILGGFEDDAGWGEFEASGENAWTNDGWGEEGAQAGDVKGSEMYLEVATVLPESEKEQPVEVPEDEPSGHVVPAIGTAVHDHASEEADPTHEDRVDEPLTQPESTTDACDAVVVSAREDDLVSHNEAQEQEDKESSGQRERPVSSSSETTVISEARTVSSARTSFDQGLPDVYEKDLEAHVDAAEEFNAQGPVEPLTTVLDVKEDENVTISSDTPPSRTTTRFGPEFKTDLGLLDQFFRSRSREERNEDSVEDLIDTTSTRRMWYRLARPQTLRGFLNGDVDDSYVRVNWTSSQIRKESIKIVSRWISEDAMHGRTVLGGTPKAAFGWNDGPTSTSFSMRRNSVTSTQSSPMSSKFPHSRQSSLSTRNTSAAASPVVHFAWSTCTAVSSFPGGGKDDIPGSLTRPDQDNPWRRSISTRPTSLHIPTSSIDAVFSDPADTTSTPQSRPETPMTVSASSAVATSATSALTIDTSLTVPTTKESILEEDDDEWGEMVHSPPPPLSPAVESKASLALSPAPITPATDIPLAMNKTRKVPLSPVSQAKQIIPDGPLSPSRKAAFNAARVTRTLSSQQSSEAPSPLVDASRVEDFTKIKLRKVTPDSVSAEGAHTSFTAKEELVLKDLSAMQATGDDLSLFESIWNSSSHDNAALKTQTSAETLPNLTPSDASKVQNFLARLPDLSYMFK